MVPRLTENGWPFAKVDPYPGAERDPFYDSSYLKEIYLKAEPNFSGRYAIFACACVSMWLTLEN